ncbi:MAG: hypothetical protein WCV67_20695 [Victivallaceae bacterium]|jgi:hypothetical protein
MNANLKKWTAAAVSISICVVANAQDTGLKPQTISDWSCGWNGGGSNLSEPAAKDGNAVVLKGNGIVFSKGTISVDPAKTYQVSGSFKAVPGSKAGRFYLGVQPLNSDNVWIAPSQVNAVAGTDAELAEPCKPEDKVIKIKGGKGWEQGQYYFIAFNTDNSGSYSDLPNSALSSMGFARVENKGDVTEITLNDSCGKEFPAGTKVRVHRDSATFMYIDSASNAPAPAEWTEFKGVFKGENPFGVKTGVWYKGTRNARIILLGVSPELELMFKDVTLEEIK